MNLLSNACKFTSDGVITVKAWVESIDEVRKVYAEERKNASIKVADPEAEPAEPERE